MENTSSSISMAPDKGGNKTGSAVNAGGLSLPPMSFDYTKFRLQQDFTKLAPMVRQITHVPVRKPPPDCFVRCQCGAEWEDPVALFTPSIMGKDSPYLVAADLINELREEIKFHLLMTSITREGDLFLWPLKLPDDTGRTNSWNDSAIVAAHEAQKKWIRVKSNIKMGYYEVSYSAKPVEDPVWPNMSFPQILQIAFAGHTIETLDHIVIKQLRGEV